MIAVTRIRGVEMECLGVFLCYGAIIWERGGREGENVGGRTIYICF